MVDGLYFDNDGSPILRNSFCVFLDILGFSNHIRTSFLDGSGKFALGHFYDIINTQLKSILNPSKSRKRWEIKVFTDNIVLGCPRPTWHSEPEFASILRQVGQYQLQMSLKNFFIRGGLSAGELFMDDTTVFGQVLLDAVDLEKGLARNPRVILSNSAVEVLKQHLNFYNPNCGAPQLDLICEDADGEYFINYLYHTLVPGPPDGRLKLDSTVLMNHRTIIEANLAKFASSPRVWDKYRWAATYHNSFLTLHSCLGGYADALLVDTGMLVVSPRPITHPSHTR